MCSHGFNEEATDEGRAMDFQSENSNGHKLGTNDAGYAGAEIHQDDAVNAQASPDENDEVPEDPLGALAQWASKTCSVCCSLLRGRVYSYEVYGNRNATTFHPSLFSLKRSVHAGCLLCKRLFVSLDKCYKGSGFRAPKDSWNIKFTVGRAAFRFVGTRGLRLCFYLFDEYGHCLGNTSEKLHGFEIMEFYNANAKAMGDLGPEYFGAASEKSTYSFDALAAYI